ncbi:hypothetical protein N7493_001294 [Penicillium malachiteum]|uniref:Carrier domain-containing protein n=1 Tax=Penicillium malachiteum TaxID=1324776 RepID=A0AAD6MZJ5_9EURO|nr:hypothetical protein N7493_001294 [Penicillium malachiteum]
MTIVQSIHASTLSSGEEYDAIVARNYGLGQLFHRRVLEDPHAIAITDGKTSFSYEELHRRAAVIAQELRQMPFETEEPVGIIVKHGIWDAVTQMGIVYAGGSCATMDPTLPDSQIRDRLTRLGTRYVLVDKPNTGRDFPYHSIDVEGLSMQNDPPSDNDFPITTNLEHRTHLIHTSGTTSEPKAVQIAARSILEVAYHAPFLPVQKTDVVAHCNNTSFDVALMDIWGPLLNGARIAILTKEVLLDLQVMAAEIDRLGITFMPTTTALLNLAATTFPTAFSKLRMCWIGGEAANLPAIKTILEQGPPENLINAYGPTECCVLCMAHHITMKDVAAGTVSIGKPIGRSFAVISDESGNPVPPGVEGELCIGGPGVSPGYANQAEKNLTSFVTRKGPLGTPERFYRTGDIVKQRVDGQVDFVGRRDHQVKVRGFRIELGTIESAMFQTKRVSEAVAMKMDALQDGAGSNLIAFVVPAQKAVAFDQSALIEDLKVILPDYMVPRIEVVDQMPLNNHAKIDRQRLSKLYRQRWEEQMLVLEKQKSEGDNTRDKLSAMWATILATPIPQYKDDDDLFALGCTSLQASLLISQIKRALQTEISLLTLYDHSTLGKLTAIIDKCRGGVLETISNERELWIADTHLADSLVLPHKPVVDWRRDTEGRVFITGATGFVGAFMLADILRMPEVHQVGCLVRARDSEVGMKRLAAALRKYDLWEESFRHKLLPLCGTLEDSWLGLGQERFEEVGSWASVIFHLGARVNYTQPYSLHRPANTIGTINVMRLAITGRLKGVHYSSSISCFGPTGYVTGAKIIYEDEPLMKHIDALPYDHGYAQSQWVAEQLLRRLMDRNFPIAIYRPGFITGHQKTGACNPDDFFSRTIHACSEMGCYPRLPNQRKEFVPVDYVSDVTLHIASSPLSLGQAFHIVPPSRAKSIDMDDTMELIGDSGGAKLQGLDYSQWIERLAANPPVRLQPLQPMLAEKVDCGLTRWELYENMPLYDTTNTMRALKSYPGGLKFPVLDSALMKRYLDYLQKHY